MQDKESWNLPRIDKPGKLDRLGKLLILRPKRPPLQPEPSMNRQGPPNRGRRTAIGLMGGDDDERRRFSGIQPNWIRSLFRGADSLLRPQTFLASLKQNKIIF